ncbi:hypothetical protein PIB30_069549 [Stylosanthes scabra]|uniref:Uncharacterized protein n=1 Tax=Stylosanthes scabra TaxID=79078 RepID=A0ABU6QMT0_9FABA|nr:hypothetical protein [Stylosanthes scabra]
MVNLNDSSGGSNEGFNYGVDSAQLEGMLHEEFESHEGSVTGDPMTEPFHLDPDHEDGRDEDVEELNSLRISQGGPNDDPTACLTLVNNLRTRRKFLWQLRHIVSGELCNSRY